MGISMGTKLIVGLPFDEVEEAHDFVEDGTLDYASTYFDSDRDDWIVGVSLYSVEFGAKEVDLPNLSAEILQAKEEFQKVTGKIGKLYLSTHIT